MDTQKLHFLDYFIEAIKHVGEIQFLHIGFFESSQKIFRTVYRKNSEQRKVVMNVAINRYNKKLDKKTCWKKMT